MKDKYFGDKHDFRKYVLLSFLQECTGYTIAINWMRTKIETKPNADGNKRNYGQWCKNNERIYRILQQPEVQDDSRSLDDFQKLNILPDDTLLWSTYVPDINSVASKKIKLKALREEWHMEFLSFSKNANMIFFDPDNGIEVKSASKGTKESYKYVYCDEIKDVFLRGQDVLIYQHKPRITLENMIQKKCSMLVPITKRKPLIFVAGEVVYFLLNRDIETSMAVVKKFRKEGFSPDFLSIVES